MNLKCSKCNEVKPCTEFHKWSSHKRGYRYHCKTCRLGEDSEKKRKAYNDNKEIYNARAKKWKEDNREKWNEYCRGYRSSENFSYKTPETRFYRAKRRAEELKATPEWSDQEKIKEIYQLSHDLSDNFNIKFEVDHIYPIQGVNSKGLHVWYNLMVLPMEVNRSKGNKEPENKMLPRVSDNFENYLSELKRYAELTLNEA